MDTDKRLDQLVLERGLLAPETLARERLYGGEHQADGEDPNAADEADVERLKDLASDAPVVRLVNGLITRASESRASDIHIEPTDDSVKVRFRVDGALKEVETLPA